MQGIGFNAFEAARNYAFLGEGVQPQFFKVISKCKLMDKNFRAGCRGNLPDPQFLV